MKYKHTDIFSDLAGSNEKLHTFIEQTRDFWRVHANRRTKVLFIVIILFGVTFYFFGVRAPSEFPDNTLITVESGQSYNDIVTALEEENVVRSAFAMKFLTKLYGTERNMHSGDYIFKTPINLFGVIRRISTGTFGLEPITVRITEGSTVADIADVLEKDMLKFDKEKFLDIASQSEGYLFPDTYYFLPNASESQIVGAMKDNFYAHYKEIADLAAKTGYSMHEIVTLASIVELEASKYEDRQKIAGVMYNRLEIDMSLQVDVSFVYIMNKGSFDVTKEDMQNESPYNTYVHKGLPPGPIGSPSMAALEATVDPLGRENGWLFYLADRNGTTHFSKTYSQHLANKRRYIDNR